MADLHIKKAGETPSHGVGEQQAHNEQWAGALCLMGRFIISHYQLIPSDRLGPAAVHQKYVRRETETEGGWEPIRWRERDVKRQAVVGPGAMGWNEKRCGENRKKPGRMREWFKTQQDVRAAQRGKREEWVNDEVEKEVELVIRYEWGKTKQELNQKKHEWIKQGQCNYGRLREHKGELQHYQLLSAHAFQE